MRKTFFRSSTFGARMLLVTAGLSAVVLISGCAKPSASANVYNYNQTQRDQIVRNGTVINVRPITIERDQTSGAGAIAGGAVGGVAGSAVGGGTGRTLAIIGGAILGALAGNAVEDQMGKKDGLEITVRLDNGETRVIAQEADLPIMMNQRVQVVSGAGPSRVVPLSQN
jgi:outer membrane lipoprotein SlyB